MLEHIAGSSWLRNGDALQGEHEFEMCISMTTSYTIRHDYCPSPIDSVGWKQLTASRNGGRLFD
jgi:hypothetical protein